MKNVLYRLLLPFCLLISCSFPAMASLNLILPTHNQNLYEHPENFYMKTDRAGDDAWMGGMYGFSRDAKNVSGETVNTRFHEGMDIAPMMRDARGEPLDTVMAIDEGTVVYVNPVAGRSNYGKYIVVRHYWNGSPFYSLYAHLNETWVDSGQQVNQGDFLGKLGYTGDGINRARAHLHFEIAMLVNENFQKWYNVEFGDNANYHSFYNGINLAGLNVASLYLRLRNEPNMSIRDFLSSEHTPFYSVLLPREGRLDLLARYPWLLKKSAMPDDPTWEITFDASGLPLAIKPSKKKVSGPTVAWVADTAVPYSYLTKSYVRGEKAKASLSSSGERFMRLVGIEQDSTSLTDMPTRIVSASANRKSGGKGSRIDEEEMEERNVEKVGGGVTGGDIRHEGKGTEAVDAMADEPVDEEGIAEQETPKREKAKEKSKGQAVERDEMKAADADVSDMEASAENESGGNGEGTAATPEIFSPGQSQEEEKADDAMISAYHTKGYFFTWIVNEKHWEVEMQPILLSIPPAERKGKGAAVDTVMARCDECARFGLSQPTMLRINPTTWKILMSVVDKGKLEKRSAEANGKVFHIELYIKANEEESVSTVKMRTAVKGESMKE